MVDFNDFNHNLDIHLLKKMTYRVKKLIFEKEKELENITDETEEYLIISTISKLENLLIMLKKKMR